MEGTVNAVITRIEARTIDVSPKTDWTFIEVGTSDGWTGTGEATLYGQEAALGALAARSGERLDGAPEDAIMGLVAETARSEDRTERTLVSAMEQALWDIRGQRAGEPVHALLGGARRARIPIYANINRGTADRTPAGFIASTRAAVAAGFTMLKIAPFDGLEPGMAGEGDSLYHAGLERRPRRSRSLALFALSKPAQPQQRASRLCARLQANRSSL